MNEKNMSRWVQDRLKKARKENYWIMLDTQEPEDTNDE